MLIIEALTVIVKRRTAINKSTEIFSLCLCVMLGILSSSFPTT